jgi:hypothetical protein
MTVVHDDDVVHEAEQQRGTSHRISIEDADEWDSSGTCRELTGCASDRKRHGEFLFGSRPVYSQITYERNTLLASIPCAQRDQICICGRERRVLAVRNRYEHAASSVGSPNDHPGGTSNVGVGEGHVASLGRVGCEKLHEAYLAN